MAEETGYGAKFEEEMDVVIPACSDCLHRWRGVRKCDAFKDEIPAEIWEGENQHREPYPGDGGIQWEQRPEGV